MNRVRFSGTAAAIALLVASAAGWAQSPKVKPASSTAAPASSSAPAQPIAAGLPAADKGVFRILLNGSEVGNEQFETAAAGTARVIRSEVAIRVPGQPEMHSVGELHLSSDGFPAAYKWTAQAEKKASGSVEFKDGSAKTLLDMENGKDPFQADFMFGSPRVAVLDNNLYYQYSLVAQLYDWNAKGQQTLAVLIPQDMTPGSITVESLGSKAVEGGTYDALRVTTADLELIAYFDARRRLMRLEVPSASVAIVRR
jgi:hypothetical protein